ncbi:hypothetical protein ROJ8625_00250 [Roseivivax jejudonensis]|uniref:Peptidase S33 tripeptidyl aminopeptidase-like C-terminal domain-containing protein n=1 Tax=Roseivivax jejudonensis TaxID=1529041 RepID=A0A1X6Y6B6_9RHOB|nr:alpha/beta hydrolase [Roseivivax jejudonensis]SLN11323.1 hypothetical protein ROJ8625_00250 [Roseivivax jejudonensis]
MGGQNSAVRRVVETASLPFAETFIPAMLPDTPEHFTICEELFEPVPRDTRLEPVTSDRQELILNGEIDVETDFSWGARAAETLPNRQTIVFPESVHGTILCSQCARDITEANIGSPQGSLDPSCIADLRPPVLLLDGTMHPLPL